MPNPASSAMNGFKPGQSGNPNGRQIGSRNKRTKEIIEQIIALGHKDPLLTLSELQHSNQDPGIRATAANMLAPFLHSKLAAKPQPPDPQYIEEAISLPRPATIRQAYENIAILTEYKATGKIDIATADSLIADQRVILNALIDEAKLLAAGQGQDEQVIRIEGGLPLLPGTNVIMPKRINGHDHTGDPLLESQAPDQPSDQPTEQDNGAP